jgi:hypothetical protein
MISFVLVHVVSNAAHTRAVTKANQQPPSGISALTAALIGVAGSVLGSVAGGLFALWAANRQSRSERGAVRLERSQQAAMDIASAWPVLEEALLARASNKISADDLPQAFNTFSRTATMQSIPITNDDLRSRIRGHLALALSSTLYADDPQQLSPRVERLRTNGGAICDAIDAYYNDKPLPVYPGPRGPESPAREPGATAVLKDRERHQDTAYGLAKVTAKRQALNARTSA